MRIITPVETRIKIGHSFGARRHMATLGAILTKAFQAYRRILCALGVLAVSSSESPAADIAAEVPERALTIAERIQHIRERAAALDSKAADDTLKIAQWYNWNDYWSDWPNYWQNF